MRRYFRLMRFDRPVGIFLLVLPCWWGVVLPADIAPLERVAAGLMFLVGAAIMRAASCVVNDLFDRKLDRQVARTRARPLATGEVSPRQALLLLSVLLLLGLGVLSLFNRATFWLGVAAVPLVFTYPFAKRFFIWPQLVLGILHNWGALMGWSALTGHVFAWPSALLYLGGVCWTLAYDTLYAFQDCEDDKKAGIYSLALCIEKNPRRWIFGFYGACLFFIALSGFAAGMHRAFYIGLFVAFLFVFFMIRRWRQNDPDSCHALFAANPAFGFLILCALSLGQFVR